MKMNTTEDEDTLAGGGNYDMSTGYCAAAN